MTQFKAAFPLGMVCLPGEFQNLHIFEPRYKQLINDIKKSGDTFVMVPFVHGKSYEFGTEVKLDEIHTEYDDGKYDISIKGINLFSILKLTKRYTDKLYPGVKVNEAKWDEIPDYASSEKLVALLHELYELLNIQNAEIPPAPELLISKIKNKIGLTLDQELTLLSLHKEKDRQKYVLQHLNNFLPEVRKMRDLQIKAALNGHFKNIDPTNF